MGLIISVLYIYGVIDIECQSILQAAIQHLACPIWQQMMGNSISGESFGEICIRHSICTSCVSIIDIKRTKFLLRSCYFILLFNFSQILCKMFVKFKDSFDSLTSSVHYQDLKIFVKINDALFSMKIFEIRSCILCIVLLHVNLLPLV